MAPESGQLYPSTRFEDQASRLGARVVAGVDEAGRGPLAGPVVAAAVVLSRDEPIAGLNDSKLLTRENRERLFAEIQSNAIAVGVGIVQPETIDRINILQATRLAMTRAVLELRPSADYLLIDG
ncbi:MAG: ribonuclease HII, partial [Deltaproteobacteria bacterium]|nr:ribonuclease HII [Deltaproteobacteria bacterium]